LSDAKDLGGGRGIVDVAVGEEAGVVGRVVVKELHAALALRGLRVEPGFGIGRQRLDLAVGHAGGPFRVGVDASFLDERDALARDVYQPSFWQRAGWTVLRVTPRMWRTDPDDVVTRVLAAISGVDPT
jgi:very-short-patch-repair endonuclease